MKHKIYLDDVKATASTSAEIFVIFSSLTHFVEIDKPTHHITVVVDS